MYNKTVLNNGVRIVYENIPYVRSVSAGIWVGMGSRYEKPSDGGASHFIEHMVFKGTPSRTASDIASEMDTIGGQINAFTTKECTCFYGKVLDTHLKQLFDILGDMFFNSLFSESDAANERGVVFEEMDMYKDTPDDLVSEKLFGAVFRGTPLSKPILGKKSTLSAMTGGYLREYMRARYLPDKTVISVSGSFTQSDIDYISSIFGAMEPGDEAKMKPSRYTPAVVLTKKKIEQNHICIAFPGLALSDDDRYAMQLLSGMLGGGMSSRLYQSVREKNGLCYSVFTFGVSHVDTGVFCIYSAFGRECEERAIRLIMDEVRRFIDGGVTDEELSRAREQVKANVLMSLESTGARMNRLGKGELFTGGAAETDYVIGRYDSVTPETIKAMSEKYLDLSSVSLSAVGRVSGEEEYRSYIGM